MGLHGDCLSCDRLDCEADFQGLSNLTEEQRHELMRVNREFLEATPASCGNLPQHSANDLQRASVPALPAREGDTG